MAVWDPKDGEARGGNTMGTRKKFARDVDRRMLFPLPRNTRTRGISSLGVDGFDGRRAPNWYLSVSWRLPVSPGQIAVLKSGPQD